MNDDDIELFSVYCSIRVIQFVTSNVFQAIRTIRVPIFRLAKHVSKEDLYYII